MTALANDTFTGLLEAWDEAPACEGGLHLYGIAGHRADQPAAWSVTWKCPQCDDEFTLLLCDGRYQWWIERQLFDDEGIHCDSCDGHSPVSTSLKRVVKL